PCHQARAGGHGPDSSGVGERDSGALEITGSQLAGTGAAHQVVEGGHVLLKIEGAGVLDVGDHQVARAVFGRDVHGDTQVDARAHQAESAFGRFDVSVVDVREFLKSLNHSPAQQVGVGNFAAADQSAVLVDDAAVLVHHLNRHGALGSGDRNRHA